MLNIKVVFVDTNKLSFESLLASSFLFDNDVAALSKYKNEEIKKEKAYSYIFRNKYIGEYKINEFGKPVSDSIFFNISHSKGAIIFAKDNKSIGIDIEKVRPVEEKLKDYISSIEERDYIKNDINFFEVWTNKESITKSIGTGIKDKIKEIPSLPLNGVKEYCNEKFYSRTVLYKGYVISISRMTDEPFDIEIKEEIYE